MRFALSAIILLLIFSFTATLADDGVVENYETGVKAAFVYNFLKFIEWSEDKENSENSSDNKHKSESITVLVVGDSVLADYLREFVNDGEADKEVEIEFSEFLNSVNNFDVIYFGSYDCSSYSKQLFDNCQGKEILTIGDCDDFISSGGMIELFLVESRVRFNINKTLADKECIRISSRLLKLAVNVE